MGADVGAFAPLWTAPRGEEASTQGPHVPQSPPPRPATRTGDQANPAVPTLAVSLGHTDGSSRAKNKNKNRRSQTTSPGVKKVGKFVPGRVRSRPGPRATAGHHCPDGWCLPGPLTPMKTAGYGRRACPARGRSQDPNAAAPGESSAGRVADPIRCPAILTGVRWPRYAACETPERGAAIRVGAQRPLRSASVSNTLQGSPRVRPQGADVQLPGEREAWGAATGQVGPLPGTRGPARTAQARSREEAQTLEETSSVRSTESRTGARRGPTGLSLQFYVHSGTSEGSAFRVPPPCIPQTERVKES